MDAEIKDIISALEGYKACPCCGKFSPANLFEWYQCYGCVRVISAAFRTTFLDSIWQKVQNSEEYKLVNSEDF